MNDHSRGFTFVELMITVGLIGIFVPAIAKTLSFSLFSSRQGEQMSQAYALAQEGMEAVMQIKSGAAWDWTSTPVNTGPGEYYQPAISGGTWQLGSITSVIPPPVTDPPFSRTLTVEPVHRCPGYDPIQICASGGVADPYSRLVTVRVSWTEPGGPQEVMTQAYVTAH